MPSDRKTEEARLEAVACAAYFVCLHEVARGLAHDLNGALNTLSLNLELVDLATAADCGGHDIGARERSLASARRAVREIQEIVERRILPVGRTAAPEATDSATLLAGFSDEATPLLNLRRAHLTRDAAAPPIPVRCSVPAVHRTWLATIRALLDALQEGASLRFSVEAEAREVVFVLGVVGEGQLDGAKRCALLGQLLAELPELPALWERFGGSLGVPSSGQNLIRFGLPHA